MIVIDMRSRRALVGRDASSSSALADFDSLGACIPVAMDQIDRLFVEIGQRIRILPSAHMLQTSAAAH